MESELPGRWEVFLIKETMTSVNQQLADKLWWISRLKQRARQMGLSTDVKNKIHFDVEILLQKQICHSSSS